MSKYRKPLILSPFLIILDLQFCVAFFDYISGKIWKYISYSYPEKLDQWRR